MSGVSMSGSGAMGFVVGVGGYQPGVYVPLKALFLVGNGARAPGIGKIRGVSVKIGRIVYRQTRLRTLLYMVIWLL